MGRIRYIKPGFWESEEIGELSPWARLLWIGIWNHADRNGVAKAKPARLRGQVFRFDDVTKEQVAGWTLELHRMGFLILFEVDGVPYCQVPNFSKHQKIHVNEKAFHPLPEPSTLSAPTQQPKEREREREQEREREREQERELERELELELELERGCRGESPRAPQGEVQIQMKVMVSQVINAWNRVAGKHGMTTVKWCSGRVKAVEAALRRKDFARDWEEMIQIIDEEGGTPSGWSKGLAFTTFLRPVSHPKIIDREWWQRGRPPERVKPKRETVEEIFLRRTKQREDENAKHGSDHNGRGLALQGPAGQGS